MRVGLGLPNADRSLVEGRPLVDLARRAESLGFATLATIGRIAYPSYEELVVLAAAAGATQRIGLMTDVLLGPSREPVLLAKQAATLDQVSGGRFVLGIAAGARPDDFEVTGRDFHRRGRDLDAALELMERVWRGEPPPGTTQPVAPSPTNGRSVPVLVGGYSDAAVRRTVRYGIGYTLGGGDPARLKDMAGKVEAAWRAAGREGRPHFRALSYFALGEDIAEEAERNVADYYGDWAPRIWAAAIKTPEQARERVRLFEAAGCDELIMFMTAPQPEQADRMAAAVLA